MIHFDFLIVGHPRCGSGFCSYYFNLLGIKTTHEQTKDLNFTGYKALSSWAMTIIHTPDDKISPRYGQFGNHWRKNITYGTKLVYLRNPFDSFKSIINENDIFWSYNIRNKYIIKKLNKTLNEYNSKLEKAIASYLFWYELLLNDTGNFFFFRIEHDLEKLHEYLEKEHKCQLNNVSGTDINTHVNSKPTKRVNLSKQDYSNVNNALMESLNDFCIKYGYPTFEEYFKSD